MLAGPSAATADAGTTAVMEVEFTNFVARAALLKFTTLELTNAVPVTVMV
jgi:hypothetical protein